MDVNLPALDVGPAKLPAINITLPQKSSPEMTGRKRLQEVRQLLLLKLHRTKKVNSLLKLSSMALKLHASEYTLTPNITMPLRPKEYHLNLKYAWIFYGSKL